MEILFGVSAKQCRDHPRKSFPPTIFCRKPSEIPMSSSQHPEVGWVTIYHGPTSRKYCNYRVKRLFWRYCSSCLRNNVVILVAEWIHFTHFGIILPYKTESVHFLGLMNSATKSSSPLPPNPPKKASPKSEARVCKLDKSILRLHKMILHDESKY